MTLENWIAAAQDLEALTYDVQYIYNKLASLCLESANIYM